MSDSSTTKEDPYEGGYSDNEEIDSEKREGDVQYVVILQQKGDTLVYRKPETDCLAAMTKQTTTKEKEIILWMNHDSRLAGHPGINKTIKLVTRNYSWPGLRKDITKYVHECDTCARIKHPRHKPYGYLQSPEILKGA